MIKHILMLIMVISLLSVGAMADEYEHVMPQPEEFYGSVAYTDGSIVECGEITVLDQRGKIIGTYNMTTDGEYGAPEKSGRRLLAHAEYLDDTLYFYVNSVKSVTRGKTFNSGEVSKFDIILPISAKPTPTSTPTPEPTIEENVTIITEIPTIVPTTIGTTINNIPTQPIPTQALPVEEDNTWKYIGAMLIAASLCVLSVIMWYLFMSRRMKRDDDIEIKID